MAKRDYRGAYRRARFRDPLRNPVATHRTHREKNFLLPGLEKFRRRAAQLTLLIREASLCGISTQQLGRVVAATLSGEW